MKRMKKILAVLLAAIMVMSMGTSVFAENGDSDSGETTSTTTYSIKIKGVATGGHSFAAYQIFDGTLSGSGKDGDSYVLSDVNWGRGIVSSLKASIGETETSIYDALKTITITNGDSEVYPFTSDKTDSGNALTSAADVTAALAKYNTNGEIADKFATVINSYLVDTATISDFSSSESNETYTYVASVTDPGYYLVKDTTSSLGADDAYTDYIVEVVGDVEVDVKSSVPTVKKTVTETNDLTGEETKGQTVADYDIGDEITYTLTGTLPSTLSNYSSYSYTFTDTLSKGLTVKKAETDITSSDVTVKVYSSSDDTTGTTVKSGYTVTLEDYSGNEEAYESGHVLKVAISDVLTDLKDSDNSTISVTKDSIIVVTYTATLDDEAIVGSTGNANSVSITYSNNPNGDSTGTTTTSEATVYTYSVSIKKVKYQENSTTDTEALAGAGFTLYKQVTSETTEATTNSDGSYWIKVKEEAAANDKTTFTFSGLDAGTYKIVESTTPSGYNTADDVTFEIAVKYETDGSIESVTVKDSSENTISGTGGTFSVDTTTYAISTTILNEAGSSLPSTGGIGTTIFYVVGAVLVLGAGVILITRRRMASR